MRERPFRENPADKNAIRECASTRLCSISALAQQPKQRYGSRIVRSNHFAPIRDRLRSRLRYAFNGNPYEPTPHNKMGSILYEQTTAIGMSATEGTLLL